MNSDKYYQLFRSLNITVEPLPTNYTPEEFGRRLHAMSQIEQDVCYASSTDYLSSQEASQESRKK